MPSRYTPVYRHDNRLTLACDQITRPDLARLRLIPTRPLPPGADTIATPRRPDPATPRFFAQALPDRPGEAVVLPADQARHATRALRLTTGDAVQLIDGAGQLADATLELAPDGSARCTVKAVHTLDRPRPQIELATAIPKGPRGDAMVNDLAQLGVDTLIPLTTRHSVVDPGPNKIERYRKAAVSASKQSLRAWLMKVEAKTPFDRAIDCDAGLKLIADPDAPPLAGLAQKLDAVSAARVLVGPEGGWHADELDAAESAGFERWRFSPNVLRVETAAAAAVAILRGV